MRTIWRFLVVPSLVLALAPSLAAQHFVFIHHSVGQDWLERGLTTALNQKAYIGEVHDITYGTSLPPDSGRPASLGSVPGDLTDMQHWVLWFNDYMAGVRGHDCSSGFNTVIMFKSCFPNSDVYEDGTEPGDPFGDRTVTNYRAVYRHPGGSGQTYEFDGRTYRPLEDIFAAHPDILFIPVTAPPLSWGESSDANAHRARTFNDWLKDQWLPSYNDAHPGLNNVAVFDLFGELAYPDDHASHPNRLRQEYGGDSGDSHPNAAGDAHASDVFANNAPNFLDEAWALFDGGEVVPPPAITSLFFPAFFKGMHPFYSRSFVGVAVTNLDPAENGLNVAGMNPGGEMVSQRQMGPVPANGQTAFVTGEAVDAGKDIRTLMVQGTDAPVRGFFMVGEYELNRLDGVGSEWAEAQTLYLLQGKRAMDGDTCIYLHNSNQTLVAATVHWMKQDGQSAAQRTLQIPPGGCLMQTLAQIFPQGPTVLDGYLRISADERISGCMVYANADTFVSLPAQRAASGNRLLAPHFYVAGDGGTQLRLVNTGTTRAQVRIRAYLNGYQPFGDETRELAPGVSLVADLAAILNMPVHDLQSGESYSGYLTLDITPVDALFQDADVIGCIVFSGNNGKFSASLPLATDGFTETLFPHLAQSVQERVFTGLASLNPGDEAVEVRVMAFNKDGQETGDVTFWLQPGERVVDLLDSAAFFGAGFSQVGGYLTMSSSLPVVSFALFGDLELAYMAAVGGQALNR